MLEPPYSSGEGWAICLDCLCLFALVFKYGRTAKGVYTYKLIPESALCPGCRRKNHPLDADTAMFLAWS